MHWNTLKPDIAHSLSLFILVVIASQQELFILRYVPAVNLAALAITRLTQWKKIQTSSTFMSSIVDGIRHTSFIWSLVKLKPSAGVALHLLAPAIDNASTKHGTLNGLLVGLLGTVIAVSAPVHPLYFALGVLATLLDLWTKHHTRNRQSTPSISPRLLQLLYPWISTLISTFFSVFIGAHVVGVVVRPFLSKWWIYVHLVSLLSAVVFAAANLFADDRPPITNDSELLNGSGVLLLCALVRPSSERIQLWDVAAFAVVALISWRAVKVERIASEDSKKRGEFYTAALGKCRCYSISLILRTRFPFFYSFFPFYQVNPSFLPICHLPCHPPPIAPTLFDSSPLYSCPTSEWPSLTV
jgi:hypothetical protein